MKRLEARGLVVDTYDPFVNPADADLLDDAAVFLIGLADGAFPLRRAIEAGDIEEERRLFYVAVTRARDELYLCFPKINTKGGPSVMQTPSRFLTEVSPELYQPLRLKRSYGW